MTPHLLPAPCQAAGRSDLLERRLRRYHPHVQGAVRALAMRHPRVADLALSFPALLFALADPQARRDPACAIASAIDGAALAQVAALVDLPMWLRKMPPEAFVRPIPPLPNGELFRRQIANHLPRSPKLAPAWLQLVADAAALAHEPLAAWIAREYVRDPSQVPPARLRRIALWAWFSAEPATTGHDLIERPWTPNMRIDAARSAASDWEIAVALHANLGRQPIADMWLRAGRLAGYEFLPLDSIAAITEEAKAMRNCLRTYAGNLAHDQTRIWGVRKDGKRVATLQIARRYRDPLPNIVQLKGPGNSEVSREVWWAARQWLHKHDLSQVVIRPRNWGTAPLDRDSWVSLWRPYWLAKRRIPDWLPLAPSREALGAL
ncbi:PcfJ domain-containing protein [Bradyrhizobium sp. CCBAU 53338]|uniref:PcfJ domain-containing protein n=1 Tax=Bradyrhizobium sp. CCBAU 53338 TaxID=1325111 RepID=UPI00188AEDE1|nr:PcfJ domain-containing protein [Bradyrhizobium sp. CCBAU 53338]